MRDKETVEREWRACLRELEEAQAKERSLCPPVEELNLHGKEHDRVPLLSEECLEAQTQRRLIEKRETQLSEEYRKLVGGS